MHEEDTSSIDNAGLKRKLFSMASSSNSREPFQVTHALKALARRRISTNKGFDIIREQQKQNSESEDQSERSAISERLGLQASRSLDSKGLDSHALTMTCPEYTAFSALAYLLDDAVEEVSKLSSDKLPLISVELDRSEGKIIIFDTSKGLQGVSISNWGTSTSQKLESHGDSHFQNQGVQDRSYGVISAGLYLGGRVIVSSRSKASTGVATLQLSRSTWEEAKQISIQKRLGARRATEEEENNSPHGSFRMVEITDLRPEVTQWNTEELRRKLKDLFLPFVQGNCASVSNGSSTNIITIMAMGLNLSAVEGGQTTIIKSLSSDRKPFTVHLHLTDSAAKVCEDGAEGSTGNATITFHYLPLKMGKESRYSLQQRMIEDHLKTVGEARISEIFPRVIVRWRGRLLMAENWKTISFLEGCKDLTLQQQRCYNRVIAFIDTDDGFKTTPSKMSLAADHCFTKSLMSCLLSEEDDEVSRVRVDVTIQGQGRPLTPQMLGLEYHNWIQDCNKKYDTDESKEDQSNQLRQICATELQNKLEVGITHTGSEEASGITQSSSPVGEDKLCGDDPAYVELLNELEMLEFELDGVLLSNSSVEAGFKLPKEILAVVRPRNCPRASHESGAFCRTEQKTIVTEPMELNLEVRFINDYISDEIALTEEQLKKSKTVFNCTNKACVRNGVQGLYSFITKRHDLTTMGTYLLAFSVVSEKHRHVAPAVARINVSASEEVENWQLCSHPDACFKHPNHWKLKSIITRIGEVIGEPLYLSGYDVYNNRVAISNVPEELHLKVGQLDGEFLELSVTIPRDRINLCADNAALELKGIEIVGGSLADIATTYAAHLWIFIHNFPVASYQLSVFPGEPASVALTECDRLDNCLRPGQVIEKFVIQAFDDFKNVVETGREIRIQLEGLMFLDKRGPTRQVAEQGCVHLGGLLKVTAEYNSKGTIAILSDEGKSLLALNFHSVYRSLRVSKMPEKAQAGSQLERLEVQVIDEDGNVDNKMDGSLHTLTLDWNSKFSVTFVSGVCTLPPIKLPVLPGIWRGRVAHAVHPELFFVLEVKVVSKLSNINNLRTATPPNLSDSIVSSPQQLMLNWNVKKELDDRIEAPPLRQDYERQLKDFIDRNTKMQRKLREQGRKVKRSEEELNVLKRTRKEVDDVEALWKEELKAIECEGKEDDQRDSRAFSPNSKNINTAPQVIELLQKQGDPPGSHAASLLLEAVVNKSEVFAAGGAGSDILGIVALLACVGNDLLNRALVDYLGIEKMLMIVCRSGKGLKYLQKPDAENSEDDSTLHAFARSKNRSISGTFRVLVLNEASFYKRKDGLPSVDENHPQRLLLIPDPWPKHETCPKGYLGYAVNLLRFNPQQLECYATPAKHSLRESLFFQLFSFLQVYDTKEHMLAAQEFHINGAVSLDGGLIHTKSFLEHVFGDAPAVKFPLLQEEKPDNHQRNSILSSLISREKRLSIDKMQLEMTQKIKALHEETGYTQMALLMKKMETKLTRARSKISVLVKEVKREEERKAEILRQVAELED